MTLYFASSSPKIVWVVQGSSVQPPQNAYNIDGSTAKIQVSLDTQKPYSICILDSNSNNLAQIVESSPQTSITISDGQFSDLGKVDFHVSGANLGKVQVGNGLGAVSAAVDAQGDATLYGIPAGDFTAQYLGSSGTVVATQTYSIPTTRSTPSITLQLNGATSTSEGSSGISKVVAGIVGAGAGVLLAALLKKKLRKN